VKKKTDERRRSVLERTIVLEGDWKRFVEDN
jgi:hypothetical protein